MTKNSYDLKLLYKEETGKYPGDIKNWTCSDPKVTTLKVMESPIAERFEYVNWLEEKLITLLNK
jgi:hypothetical protein